MTGSKTNPSKNYNRRRGTRTSSEKASARLTRALMRIVEIERSLISIKRDIETLGLQITMLRTDLPTVNSVKDAEPTSSGGFNDE